MTQTVTTAAPTTVTTAAPTATKPSTPSAPSPTALSPIAAPSSTNSSPYGVSFGATELDPRTIPALDWAGRTGIALLRIVFFWARIEPNRGHQDWSGYDALIAKARKVGMSITGQISFVTEWNTSAPFTVLRPALREHYPPSNLNVWAQYVETLVGRYKGEVHDWEVWNEPDLKLFWGGSAAEYAHLLAVTYTTIKRVDPTATVAMGGLSLGGTPGSLDKNFFQKILDDPKYPARSYFDVANFHAYGTTQEIDQRLAYMRSQLTRVGAASVPIWVTEIGYPSDRRQQHIRGFEDGPTSQANWLVDSFNHLRQAGIQRLFWFQLYDGLPVPRALSDPFGTDGLLDSSLNPKPALQSYKELIASHP